MKKTTVFIPIIACALAAGSAAKSESAVLGGDERAYAVEVISTDLAAKTLVIKSNDGVSTLFVDDTVLGRLQSVRPGDRITISVRDEYTGRRKVVTAFVAGTMTNTMAKRPAAKTVIMRQPGTAVEFMNLDPGTRTITVLGESGDRQVFHVDERAMLSMADVRPGQKIFLSYRYDINGRPEAVVRVAPVAVTAAPVSNFQTGALVEVVSADPLERTLTIRNDSGERRTLIVDDRALLNLRTLRAGDSVLVRTEDDKVVVITRRD